MANKNLNAAKTAKKDEFYTQMTDIERELQHYWPHFKDKVVLCNCDDPYESNFFKYFALRFNQLGLKKLICTCYDGSPVAGTQLSLFSIDAEGNEKKTAYKVEITEVSDVNGDGAVDLADVEYLIQNDKNVLSVLRGNGDFRSPECIELLKQADIVVTNPPFSLFRDYVALLMEYEKKFLIMGRMSALHYSDIFPLLMDNKMWCGFGFNISVVYKAPYENAIEANRKFVRSKGFDPDDNYIKVPAICWYTNLDHSKRHEELDLVCHFSPEKYRTYFNYDAIDVGELADIPFDYAGEMGVPDTILGCYNPDQFEIIGMASDVPKKYVHESIDGKTIVFRDGNEIIWSTPYTVAERKLGNSLRIDNNGVPGASPYSRIIIRNKNPKTI